MRSDSESAAGRGGRQERVLSHVSRHSPLPSPARRAPRRIVNKRFRRQQKKFVRRRTACRDAKRNGQHGRSDFCCRSLSRPAVTFRTPTHRVSSPFRRGCFVVLPLGRCPSCLRSTGPPFGHGFVGTGDSRIDAGNRTGYRPVDTATGERVSRENTTRRSLHKTVKGTPPRTACLARRSMPSMRVTSGPGVPTGGSLPHATAS